MSSRSTASICRRSEIRRSGARLDADERPTLWLMPTFKITLAYDGTDFAGWQWQPEKRTVQDELEAALERITQARPKCFASGRTDAGVHALGQVVSFDSETRL